MAVAPLTVNKKAVTDRLVTQQEFDQIVGWLSESLGFESQGRVRQVMLIAKAHAITCAQKLGRGEKTQAFLRCLAAPLPRLWEALNEQEANHADMETDLVLDEGTCYTPPPADLRGGCAPLPTPFFESVFCGARLPEIEDLEEEECSFMAELSAVYVPFDQSGEEETAPPSWKLERVSEGLKQELADFTKHRTDPLVRAREGTACVDITVGNDKATVLRCEPLPPLQKDFPSATLTLCALAQLLWLALCDSFHHPWAWSLLPSYSFPMGRGVAPSSEGEGMPLQHAFKLRQLPRDGRFVCQLYIQAGRRDAGYANFPTRRDPSTEIPV